MAEIRTGYEMMVIFKPLLPDDVRKASHKALVDLVNKYKGEVINADVWGKRYLAYPIQGHEEGYYIVYDIDLSPVAVVDFEKEVRRIPEFLRFLVTKIQHPEDERVRLNKKIMDI